MTSHDPLDRLLGAPLAAVVREVVPRALSRACEDAGDVHQAYEHSDGFTYGTMRWRFGQAELAEALLEAAHGQRRNAGHLRLTGIGPEGRVVLYPVAVGYTRAALETGALKIRSSANRRRLLGGAIAEPTAEFTYEWSDGMRAASPAPTPALEDPGEVIGGDSGEDQAATEAQVAAVRSQADTVLVVAYTSNPASGLLCGLIGEATMDEEGHLDFAWSEPFEPPVVAPGVFGVTDATTAPERTFTHGSEPELGDMTRPPAEEVVNEGSPGRYPVLGAPAPDSTDDAPRQSPRGALDHSEGSEDPDGQE